MVWRGDHYFSVWLDTYGDRTDALYMAVNQDGTPRGPVSPDEPATPTDPELDARWPVPQGKPR